MRIATTLAALGAVVFTAATAQAEAPPALGCLAKYYVGSVVEQNGAWGLRLPSGTFVVWDDGKPKTLEQKLDAPDLQDIVSIRYPKRGAKIVPITDEEFDPGRIRVEPLLAETFPIRDMKKVEFAGKKVSFAGGRAAAALERVGQKLAALQPAHPELATYLSALGGTYNDRKIAGTDRKSAHSFALAIDLNPKLSDYWRWAKAGPDGKPKWKNQIPAIIVDVFEAEGFIWGGRWYHFDSMHFEYRPEMLDDSCY